MRFRLSKSNADRPTSTIQIEQIDLQPNLTKEIRHAFRNRY